MPNTEPQNDLKSRLSSDLTVSRRKAHMKKLLIPDVLDTKSIAYLRSGKPVSAGLHSN